MTLIPTSTKKPNAGHFAKDAFKNTGYVNPNEHKTMRVITELYIGDMRIMTLGSKEIKSMGKFKKSAEKWKKDTNEILKSQGQLPTANYKCYTTTDVAEQFEKNKMDTLLKGGTVITGYKK